jgi:hypothetical protein
MKRPFWPTAAPDQRRIERAVPRQGVGTRQLSDTSVSSTTPWRQDTYEHRTEAANRTELPGTQAS